MTPDREAAIRKALAHAGWLIYRTDARDLLAALDAERVARAAAEKERDTYLRALESLLDTVSGSGRLDDPSKDWPALIWEIAGGALRKEKP